MRVHTSVFFALVDVLATFTQEVLLKFLAHSAHFCTYIIADTKFIRNYVGIKCKWFNVVLILHIVDKFLCEIMNRATKRKQRIAIAQV